MNRIIQDGNWREVDTLDGKDLEDGEELILLWADGTFTAEPIVVQRGSYQETEQGGPINGTTIPTAKAFVRRVVSGAVVNVPIVGLNAVRNIAPKIPRTDPVYAAAKEINETLTKIENLSSLDRLRPVEQERLDRRWMNARKALREALE